MSSENKDPHDKIVELGRYLNTNQAVGNEHSSGIYSESDTYADASSTYHEHDRYIKYSPVDIKDEEIIMEDNKLLEIYMNKIDRDQRELRNDMRERESRIAKQISEAEARESERMSRIEKMIQSQNDTIDALKDEVRDKLEEDKKYRHTNNIAIVLGVIATVLAMVGIYYATVSTITDIVGAVIK